MGIMNFVHSLLVFTAMLSGATAAHAQPVSGQGTWESTLQARDIGNTGTTNAFYDTSLNITWLANANVNGQMDWNTAGSWANNLTVGGIGGWRLPTMSDPATTCNGWTYNGGTNCGYNVATSSSEMASLFFNTLGNKSLYDTSDSLQASWGLPNTGSFQNMQSNGYWLGTEYATVSDGAWGFYTNDGLQTATNKVSQLNAVAVRNGDVAPVPEPETYAMLLAGMGLVGAVVRRRRQSDKSLVSKS